MHRRRNGQFVVSPYQSRIRDGVLLVRINETHNRLPFCPFAALLKIFELFVLPWYGQNSIPQFIIRDEEQRQRFLARVNL